MLGVFRDLSSRMLSCVPAESAATQRVQGAVPYKSIADEASKSGSIMTDDAIKCIVDDRESILKNKMANIKTADTLSEDDDEKPTRTSSNWSIASKSSEGTWQAELEIITRTDLEDAMFDRLPVATWSASKFKFKQTLQSAPRNHGSVDLMQSIESGSFVAVKKMPNKWMTKNAQTFREAYPESTEQPWWDLAILKCLKDRRFPYMCEFSGVFRDDSFTYVLNSFANEGDLLSWCDNLPKPGKDRNAIIIPFMRDLFTGVKMLHDMGVAHGDLSMENILVSIDSKKKAHCQIIDFGMSGLDRMRKGPVRAKPSYTAPEAYETAVFDRFLADCFALGVILFGLAANDYIWYSTKPGNCDRFSRVRTSGLQHVLQRRRVRVAAGERLFADVVPTSLFDSIVGLAAINPQERWTVGEKTWESESARMSVWRTDWITKTL